MKVGILTYHRAKNYGAFLQSYALCSKLNMEKDVDAEIIDFQMEKEIIVYRLNTSLKHIIAHPGEYLFMHNLYESFENAMDEQTLSEDYCRSDNVEEFKQFATGRYDLIIAGSDEIWNIKGVRGFPTPYWLPGNLKCAKVSYGASFGSGINKLNAMQIEEIKNYLKDFSLISVRDEVTYKQVCKILENRNQVLLSPDPTLIYKWNYNINNGRKILYDKCKNKSKKKIAIVMTENKMIADSIKERFSKEYILVSVFHYHKGYINISKLSPFEWINVIAAADFVFTSYFHATCFSIITKVPFMAFGTTIKNAKIKDLLNRSNNQYRLYEVSEEKIKGQELKKQYDQCLKPVNNDEFLQACCDEFENFLKLLKTLL